MISFFNEHYLDIKIITKTYTVYAQKKYSTLEDLRGSVQQCFESAFEVTAEQMKTVSLVKS